MNPDELSANTDDSPFVLSERPLTTLRVKRRKFAAILRTTLMRTPHQCQHWPITKHRSALTFDQTLTSKPSCMTSLVTEPLVLTRFLDQCALHKLQTRCPQSSMLRHATRDVRSVNHFSVKEGLSCICEIRRRSLRRDEIHRFCASDWIEYSEIFRAATPRAVGAKWVICRRILERVSRWARCALRAEHGASHSAHQGRQQKNWGFHTHGVKILTQCQEHSPLGIMLNLMPDHQNFDASIKTSNAALPVLKPIFMRTQKSESKADVLASVTRHTAMDAQIPSWAVHARNQRTSGCFVRAASKPRLPHRLTRLCSLQIQTKQFSGGETSSRLISPRPDHFTSLCAIAVIFMRATGVCAETTPRSGVRRNKK